MSDTPRKQYERQVDINRRTFSGDIRLRHCAIEHRDCGGATTLTAYSGNPLWALVTHTGQAFCVNAMLATPNGSGPSDQAPQLPRGRAHLPRTVDPTSRAAQVARRSLCGMPEQQQRGRTDLTGPAQVAKRNAVLLVCGRR